VSGAYNPNNWPNDGYYNVTEWEVRVTVTSSSSLEGQSPIVATATVAKPQHRPKWQYRSGICVQQDPVKLLSPNIYAANQVEWDNNVDLIFKACWNGAPQVYLSGATKDYSAQGFETMFTRFDWTALKTLVDGRTVPTSGNLVSDLHYLGHGGPNGIGFGISNSTVGQQLTATALKKMMTNGFMFYVCLDGCMTSESPGLLSMFLGGVDKQMTRSDCVGKGKTPCFGLGFKGKVNIAYFNQGTLFHRHFTLMADYYSKLAEPNQITGYLLNTFEDSVNFAKNPNGNGIDPTITHNDDGADMAYVGCTDCFFDDLP
jgi:hypothetical protein